MAASLLRLGRLGSLKCIQQESWSSPRIPYTAAFSTKAQDPEKPAKKVKAASKSLEASDERAALLAYKTAVAFPTRLSIPGYVSNGVALGASEPSTTPLTAESVVTTGISATEHAQTTSQISGEAPTKGDAENTSVTKAVQAETVLPETPATGSIAPVDEAVASGTVIEKDQEASSSSSSSSSSSESDSDSDSDSDDEKPDKPEKTTTTHEEKPGQEKLQKAVGGESVPEMKTAKSIPEGVTAELEGRKPKKTIEEDPKTMKESPAEQVPPPSSPSPTASAEKIADPVKSIPKAIPVKESTELPLSSASEVQTESLPENNSEVSPEVSPQVDATLPEALTKGTASAQKQAPDSVKDVPSEAEAAPDSVAEDAAKVQAEAPPSEDLLDPAPVITEAAEPASETEVTATPQEPAPKPEPEPEPFDNTTYKNLQHHSYHTYTFVDVDVELSKFRLPQPSTGRPSPRH